MLLETGYPLEISYFKIPKAALNNCLLRFYDNKNKPELIWRQIHFLDAY